MRTTITPLEAVSRTYGILSFGWAVQICYMYRLPVNSNTACVPHTPYTLVLKFVPPAGRVCGAATHAVGGDAGYGLLASLVGIAPHPRESGETKFKSRCFGGRSAVRKVLYMATVVATRFEPLIRDFYQRLLSKGKPYKVAVTACMRKLLTILNARMRDYFAGNGITENGIRTA